MRYAVFEEDNEWEGETWAFYIPIDDNKEELNRLLYFVDALDIDSPYSMGDADSTLSEEEVDTLINHGDAGYLPLHNKLAGKLLVPDDLREDDLYKGGIEKLMHI